MKNKLDTNCKRFWSFKGDYAKNCVEIGYYLEELQRNEAGAAHTQQIRSKLETPLSIYFCASRKNNLIPQLG